LLDSCVVSTLATHKANETQSYGTTFEITEGEAKIAKTATNLVQST